MVTEELAKAGKSWENFEVSGGGFVVTGPDEAAVARAAEGIRYRVAFYGSTPAYRGVLDLHGHGELGDRLNQMSRRGEWSEMANESPTRCWICSSPAPPTTGSPRRSSSASAAWSTA